MFGTYLSILKQTCQAFIILHIALFQQHSTQCSCINSPKDQFFGPGSPVNRLCTHCYCWPAAASEKMKYLVIFIHSTQCSLILQFEVFLVVVYFIAGNLGLAIMSANSHIYSFYLPLCCRQASSVTNQSTTMANDSFCIKQEVW